MKLLFLILFTLVQSMILAILNISIFDIRPLNKCKITAYRCLLGCRLGKGCFIGRNVKVILPKNLEIGNDSAVMYETRIECRDKVTIGKGCTIGPQVLITTGNHDPKNLKPMASAVSIGDGVFIGARSIILPGVKIGSRAIIGAGSCVTRDVSPKTIVAGIPAKIIRENEVDDSYWTINGYRS